MSADTKYMLEALKLAQQGWPNVQPNPLVGCVITHEEKIVAQGYHEKFGGPHAEVNAINALPAGIDPAKCTMYVTLEPCSHFGKTPPCTKLIISKGFKKVVTACTDPNPLVSGNGILQLLQADVEVITGVLTAESKQMNRRFMTFYEKKRPYVTLKWAQTADGFISRMPLPASRKDNFISGPISLEIAHRLRAEHMAVLVGSNTALADNSLLTTRLAPGKNPTRVLIDRTLKVPADYQIYNEEAPTLVFNAQRSGEERNIKYVKIDFDGDVIDQVLHKLHQYGIQTLLVEGGTKVLNVFIKAGLYDEVFVFENPHLTFGQGLRGPEYPLPNTFELAGDDKMYHQERVHPATTVPEIF